MKKMILVFLVSLLSGITFAQNYKAETLVNKVWTIKSDEMSGVGVHTSLATNTESYSFHRMAPGNQLSPSVRLRRVRGNLRMDAR